MIDSSVPGPIGGIETRSWLFARTLSQRSDVEVAFVIRDVQRPQSSLQQGVTLHTLCEPLTAVRRSIAANIVRRPGFPGFTIRRWSWGLIWKLPLLALAKLSRQPHGLSGGVDPFLMTVSTDVFCTFGVNPASASAVATAHARELPAVLVLGSDGDLDERFLEGAGYTNQYGDRGEMSLELLRRADAIVAQSPQQQALLKTRFGRESTLIVNPIDIPVWLKQLTLSPPIRLPEAPYVLWIGRAEHAPKHPLKALEIARALPAVPFVMVLNPFDAVVEEQVYATRPANVTIISRVAPDAMASVFQRALALLNTSSFEGFPNTFLQAALSGVPIVSLDVSPRSSIEPDFALCTQGDVAAAIAILRQIAHGHVDRSRLEQLKEAIYETHDAHRQAEKLLDVCAACITRQQAH